MTFKYYKTTLWDKIFIEGGGYLSTILLFLGIWVDKFRWQLIFSSIFVFILILSHYAVLRDKDKQLKEIDDKK